MVCALKRTWGIGMNAAVNNKTALRSLNILNIFLLATHFSLLIFFAALHIRLMAYVNIVSVLWYLASFLILHKNGITLYIFATFAEIMAHMTLAVLSMGWDSGFPLYFIGCIAIVFYADYFSVRLGQRHFKGSNFSIVSGTLYFCTMLATRLWGSIYEIDTTLSFVCLAVNSLVVFCFVTLFFGMLTRMAHFYEDALAKQATHDKLTGLVNRHYLVEQLEEIYASGDMSGYWLAILDIDNFKGINDRYGHLCGDFVLKTVAEMVKSLCGDRIVCRWGGEEFVIVGNDHGKNKKGIDIESALLEDIRRNVAIKDFVYDPETTVNLTVTIGMSHYRDGQTVDEWVNRADGRLYWGKQNGKNKVVEKDMEPQ